MKFKNKKHTFNQKVLQKMYKILLFGKTGSGKTTLRQKYFGEEITWNFAVLPNMILTTKKLKIPENNKINHIQHKYLKLLIIEIIEKRTKHHKFPKIPDKFDIGLLIIDLSTTTPEKINQEVINLINKTGLSELLHNKKKINQKLILVGNKIDLLTTQSKKILNKKISTFAKKININYILISAKSGENLTALEKLVISKIYKSEN